MHDAGIHLQVDVIGLHVEPKERTQLQCVAKAGGGKYYDAANAGELKVAASEVKERIEATPAPTPPAPSATPTYVKRGEPLYGDPIRGGDSYEQAMPLSVAKLFHLDHQQPKQAHDFFSVQVKGGQTIKVSIVAGPSNGAIGAIIANPKHEKLTDTDIDGPRRSAELLQDVADQQDGTYYIMIGSPYYPEEMDDTFRVDLIDNFDGNTDRDAGSDENRALEVAPGTYPHNYMSDVDAMDVFKYRDRSQWPQDHSLL